MAEDAAPATPAAAPATPAAAPATPAAAPATPAAAAVQPAPAPSPASIVGQAPATQSATDKPAEAATDKPAEAVAAEEFKLELPEGFKWTDDTVEKSFKELMQSDKSPSQKAQGLLDMHISAMKAFHEQNLKLWSDTQVEWQSKVKADVEIGGDNFTAVESTIGKVIDQFGGKESKAIREAFDMTGAGNHPEVVRLLYRMGKMLTEGSPIPGGNASPAGQSADGKARSPASILYPTTEKAA